MAYSTPPTWVNGNVVTAAKLTTVSDDLAFLYTGAYEAWTTYTPTLTQSATVTKTVGYSKYTKFGRTVHAQGILNVTGSGTASNIVVVGLPVTAIAASGIRPIGEGIIFDTSASLYYRCFATQASTTTLQFLVTSTTSANYAGIIDFTAGLASGDAVSWNITYESAS